MTYCECQPKPRKGPNPRRHSTCSMCAKQFNPAWVSSDENMRLFFNRLTVPSVPSTFAQFRAHCERRELAGRDTFGFEYLARNNRVEALEEFADGALYAYLDSLDAIRDGRGDEDMDLVLEVAYHAAKAYDAALRLEHKRRGEP